MILVVGGAGYIGSHAVKQLINSNYEVIVLDNLSTGHREAIHSQAIFIKGDMQDGKLLKNIFTDYDIQCVMHFAANCYVGESIEDPLKYYRNNVAGTISLLDVMVRNNVKKIIFSSTCAVYGTPTTDMLTEGTLKNPINPYGKSKLMIEEVIQDLNTAYGLEFIILRYFNVGGADFEGDLGEDHTPETHLIPNILLYLEGKKENLEIYGDDYPTKDGTCIRDFIHVVDLAHAHLLTLESLLQNKYKNTIYNVGNEKGYSVLEVLRMCEKITGKQSSYTIKNRRPGDPARLIASSNKIFQELGWKATYSLEDMIKTSWEWFRRNPNGYQTIINKG